MLATLLRLLHLLLGTLRSMLRRLSSSLTTSFSNLKQLFSSSDKSSSNAIPAIVLDCLQTAPFTIAQFPGQGRGLKATQPIQQGHVVHRERPFLCVPAWTQRSKVCYHCLRVLSLSESPSAPVTQHRRVFCSQACSDAASASFFGVESRLDLSGLEACCDEHGERFPLLAARLACMQLQRRVSRENRAGTSQQERQRPPGASFEVESSRGAAAGSNINSRSNRDDNDPTASEDCEPPQAAACSSSSSDDDPCEVLRFLCFANVPPPPPLPWQEAHSLLAGAIEQHMETAEEGPDAGLAQAAAELDLAWYIGVMARLHVNSFRVDAVLPLDWRDPAALASAAAAAAAAGGGGASSGSALYTVASLLNHSCEPNLHITWPHNDARMVCTAARGIAVGEQLTISYIDSSADVLARREYLRFAYGFVCGCARCREELEVVRAQEPPQLGNN